MRFEYARLPWARFSITKTGIDAVVTPAIGPTVSWWWHGSKRTSPDAASRSASSMLGARPSSRSAPRTAPRNGPLIRSQAMGGPACSTVSRVMPGNHVARRLDVDQHRLGTDEQVERALIRSVDVVVPQTGEQCGHGRRPPVDGADGHGLGGQGVGEESAPAATATSGRPSRSRSAGIAGTCELARRLGGQAIG